LVFSLSDFQYKFCMHFSYFPCVSCTRTAQSPWFHHRINIWRTSCGKRPNGFLNTWPVSLQDSVWPQTHAETYFLRRSRWLPLARSLSAQARNGTVHRTTGEHWSLSNYCTGACAQACRNKAHWSGGVARQRGHPTLGARARTFTMQDNEWRQCWVLMTLILVDNLCKYKEYDVTNSILHQHDVMSIQAFFSLKTNFS
jgi:hypothetical protein